jgi:membrane associated rhomboid family serine protease
VQAQVGSHCVECARQERPDVRTRARYWSARQPTLVTYTLIALNLGIFAWLAFDDPSSLSGTGGITQGQFDLGLAEPLIDQGEWYRLVTSGFLHFGVIHLAFNMLLLFQLGQLLEPAIGRIRFALLYFAALLGGSAGALLLQPNEFHGGASGAVFGLMGAAFVGLRHRGVNPLTTGLGTVLIINLLLTFTISNISIGGHIGGLVGGAAAGWVVLAPDYKRVPHWATYAAPLAVIALSVIISVAVTSGS